MRLRYKKSEVADSGKSTTSDNKPPIAKENTVTEEILSQEAQGRKQPKQGFIRLPSIIFLAYLGLTGTALFQGKFINMFFYCLIAGYYFKNKNH